MKLRRFSTRPVLVDAVLVTAASAEEIVKWCGGKFVPEKNHILIPTLDGAKVAAYLEWVVRDPETGVLDVWMDTNFREMFQLAETTPKFSEDAVEEIKQTFQEEGWRLVGRNPFTDTAPRLSGHGSAIKNNWNGQRD